MHPDPAPPSPADDEQAAATQVGLDTLPDGIVLADGDGVVTHLNARARQLLGCAGPG
ncbi:PAS domain-containing protein [Nocardioides sp.]|uniref:PAS domain-containing protein n=1 Tax=Nocardioides sp. TaxID=35761 RepID=UPI002734F60E|nr:PAS domain-containing protein [Nocardioides sp.]MDP3892209.1 PAS domain-containing protein [Nocardioides sp.]